MVGIHPTDAEAFASLAVTKSSGVRVRGGVVNGRMDV
jgi:hypothetical protein